ncbi:hypothetical protein [Wolbachia endosymbiont of Mansonella perstans]|uniref:hypothetical protein n=1 Tax=Wolbachia endosymbiont of Mansonella perstans TaxID=229526 RepID=UPI001CE093CD|nr:hypothetical protein [Wolbachia endosymbiont of Mansonella perstans]MCA4773838.1 hypothetical protein [Wolbachia endosymbiont of Mansonella perstans]
MPSGEKCTVTSPGLTTILDRQQSIKAILDAAREQGIQKEVFADIEKGDHGKIKTILKEAED